MSTIHTHVVSEFDTREFRRSLGKFATGVTVITARAADGHPVGFTANSFASASLEPPLVMWNLARTSANLEHFERCSHYAVNVLSHDQLNLSLRFARSASDKFVALDFTDGAGGAPLLAGCCAWFECNNETRHAAGDHLIFVGRVERFARAERAPLLYHGGHYGLLTRHPDSPERK
jgi:3-hydroxy-9,10-secoandrosta-1,3,5(10)-triene-9,17-dione monooxygenase reductase component